jgi:alcohol dehydrogenase (NADP+)
MKGHLMLTINAYAATSPTDPLAPTTITRRDVGPRDVLIEIAYTGVCHSDIHTVRGDWGPIFYPQVVGHEAVGTVVEVGADVAKHAAGDRVGVGTIVNSCRECVRVIGRETHAEAFIRRRKSLALRFLAGVRWLGEFVS